MIDYDELCQSLTEALPRASVVLDIPSNPAGETWIDIDLAGASCVVSYRPSVGFGIFNGSDVGYGSRPSEIVRDPDLLVGKITQTLKS